MHIQELRAMAAGLIPHLTWRHHGIGLLQAYIRESKTQDEIRLHIWHPALTVPGIENSGAMHDHRYTLTSTILHGTIEDTSLYLTETFAQAGAFQKFAVINARAGDVSPPQLLPGYFRIDKDSSFYNAGATYYKQSRTFHQSHASDLAVTLVRKTQPDPAPAIILAPTGTNPVHAFADPMPSSAFPKYLDWAIAALRGE